MTDKTIWESKKAMLVVFTVSVLGILQACGVGFDAQSVGAICLMVGVAVGGQAAADYIKERG